MQGKRRCSSPGGRKAAEACLHHFLRGSDSSQRWSCKQGSGCYCNTGRDDSYAASLQRPVMPTTCRIITALSAGLLCPLTGSGTCTLSATDYVRECWCFHHTPRHTFILISPDPCPPWFSHIFRFASFFLSCLMSAVWMSP